MNRQQQFKKYINYSLLFITVYSVLPYGKPSFDILKYLNISFIWWLIIFLIIVVLFLAKKFFFEFINKKNLIVVKIYLLYNILSICYGFFVASDYWEWKALFENAFVLLLPLVVYFSTNTFVVQSILSYYLKYLLPLFIVFSFLIYSNVYGLYLVPISLLTLFLPVLTNRWKLIIILIVLMLLTIDLDARSTVIKFGVPLLLLVFYYFRKIISNKFIEILRLILLVSPIFFFILGSSGVFNVFQMDSYIKGDYSQKITNSSGTVVEESDLLADTRTPLYVEVLNTAKTHNSWLFGRSPAHGNDTELFDDIATITGKAERSNNEVGILNVFTWTGLIGVILYFFIFFRASYLAVNKSNSIFAKMLGIYIAFRWCYAWVEDIYQFSLTMFFLWIMLGLCFSSSFRRMTNYEVRKWVKGVFDIRYRTIEYINKNKIKKIERLKAFSNSNNLP